jgi:hypothetical protein
MGVTSNMTINSRCNANRSGPGLTGRVAVTFSEKKTGLNSRVYLTIGG